MQHTKTCLTALCSPRSLRWLCALCLASCAEDLRFEPYTEPEVVAPFTTEDNGDDTFTTRVLADDAEAWVYFDFQSGGEATPDDPEDDDGWDLAFQRFHIRSNGGSSGSGDAEVAVLAGEDFAALATAPERGYIADREDGDDEGTEPDTAFEIDEGWYAYDPSSHTLTPRALVYVVRTPEGDHFKLEMLGYYDEAGNDARPSFRWAALEAPPGARGN